MTYLLRRYIISPKLARGGAFDVGALSHLGIFTPGSYNRYCRLRTWASYRPLGPAPPPPPPPIWFISRYRAPGRRGCITSATASAWRCDAPANYPNAGRIRLRYAPSRIRLRYRRRRAASGLMSLLLELRTNNLVRTPQPYKR